MEIAAVGGYNEVGKNMTALKIGDEAVVLDMGFHLPKIIDFEEEGGDRRTVTTDSLRSIGAIPEDRIIDAWKTKVRAIALGHCHLDHIGAAPYLGSSFPGALVLGTPYTLEVLKAMMDDELRFDNKLKTVQPNSSLKISDNIEVEFINMTHSTLQSTMMAVHTKEGTILYANDFKFDNHPVVGSKANIERLRELGKEDRVKALIVESIYANDERKTPSEKVAREMLKDLFMSTENEQNLIVATTFASHIARLKSIIDFGEAINRKIVILGRSMHKYITSAESLNLVNFSDRAEIIGYAGQIKRKLKEVEKQGRSKYLVICTGGQGEPGSVLQKMAADQLSFEFQKEDHVIFSNRVIPVEVNRMHREALEKRLRDKKARIFSNIHVSGHAGREDLRDLIKMTSPEHIIPAHGEPQMLSALGELSEELGYTLGVDIHIMGNGKIITV
ncbi:RNase J family beta-CASP ribonuclease [Candidatus Woesearchaeota archaeon]|nr:RNase J family beta-CASP ribonuclease [Candidatus Woesearchaeota archaeon]